MRTMTGLSATFPSLLMVAVLAGCQRPVSELHDRAEVLIRNNRLQDAEQILIGTAKRMPASWRNSFLTGKLRLKQRRPLDAQLALQRSRAILGEGEAMPEILDLIALAMYRQGDPARDDLVAFLREAVDTYGQTTDYLRQGYYLHKLGDNDNAIIALRKGASIAEPDDPRPYVALGDFYAAIGQTEQAVQQLKYAYTLDPEDKHVHKRLRDLGVVPGPTLITPIPPREP